MNLFRRSSFVVPVVVLASGCFVLHAQDLKLRRDAVTVMVEPYAPNVVRVTLSLMKDRALAEPGYGITAQPAITGWTADSGAGGDVLRSSRMVVTVAPQGAAVYTDRNAGGHQPLLHGLHPVCRSVDQDA